MGDTDELLAWLRQKHQEMPDPEAGSFYSIAAAELLALGGRLADAAASWRARAVRAEAVADRLADAIGDPDRYGEVLDLHDKEVEAR